MHMRCPICHAKSDKIPPTTKTDEPDMNVTTGLYRKREKMVQNKLFCLFVFGGVLNS